MCVCVCVCVIKKPQQSGGIGPISSVAPHETEMYVRIINTAATKCPLNLYSFNGEMVSYNTSNNMK